MGITLKASFQDDTNNRNILSKIYHFTSFRLFRILGFFRDLKNICAIREICVRKIIKNEKLRKLIIDN